MFEVRRATLEDVDSIVKITQEAFEKYILNFLSDADISYEE